MFFKENKKRERQQSGEDNLDAGPAKRAPAWTDDNTKGLKVNINDVSRLRKFKTSEAETKIKGDQYQQRLKEQYNSIVGSTDLFNWAAPSETTADTTRKVSSAQNEVDPITALLQSNTRIYSKEEVLLKPGHLNFHKLINANYGHEHQSIVSSLNFHPSQNILLSSGLDRKVKLFEVSHTQKDGQKPNFNNISAMQKSKKLQSIFLPDLPVYTARFILDGDEALLTGNRKHYYSYNIGANKLEKYTVGTLDQKNLSNIEVSKTPGSELFCLGSNETGEAHILSQKSKKLLFSLKMNGSCSAAAFAPNDQYLYTAGDQGDIYQWDLKMRKCVQKISDEGSFHTTCLSASRDGKFLASGNKMGTVNIFSTSDLSRGTDNVTPLKTIMNLTTSITDLQFNPTSQLLGFCSKWKKNALRLVHIPSFSVYQNFPGAAVGVLKYPFNIDFSHSSAYMSMGNDEGKCHLYNMYYFNK